MSSTYLVTGASSGIGKQVSVDLAKAGHSVLLVGRDATRTEQTLQECQKLNSSAHQKFLFDFAAEDITTLVDQLPKIHGLVHCAGISKLVPIRNVSLKMFEETMAINLYAPSLLTSHLIKKDKIHHGGSVVFLSSVASTHADKGQLVYAMSKAALDVAPLVFTKEFTGSTKIRFNSIRSSYVTTPMNDRLGQIIGQEALKQIELENVPLGFSSPADVSALVQFLLSARSSQISGTCIRLDGGEHCSLF